MDWSILHIHRHIHRPILWRNQAILLNSGLLHPGLLHPGLLNSGLLNSGLLNLGLSDGIKLSDNKQP